MRGFYGYTLKWTVNYDCVSKQDKDKLIQVKVVK